MEFPATVDETDAPAKTVFERLNEAAAGDPGAEFWMGRGKQQIALADARELALDGRGGRERGSSAGPYQRPPYVHLST
jgi:hypothetical protein